MEMVYKKALLCAIIQWTGGYTINHQIIHSYSSNSRYFRFIYFSQFYIVLSFQ